MIILVDGKQQTTGDTTENDIYIYKFFSGKSLKFWV